MRITADTNVLVRAAVMDDSAQGAIAARALLQAEAVAVTLPALCEFVWVLMRAYKRNAAEVETAVRALVESERVLVDRPAVEAGLDVLERGGDFADGVIAFEGRRAGGRVFATFDERAAKLVGAIGGETRVLTAP